MSRELLEEMEGKRGLLRDQLQRLRLLVGETQQLLNEVSKAILLMRKRAYPGPDPDEPEPVEPSSRKNVIGSLRLSQLNVSHPIGSLGAPGADLVAAPVAQTMEAQAINDQELERGSSEATAAAAKRPAEFQAGPAAAKLSKLSNNPEDPDDSEDPDNSGDSDDEDSDYSYDSDDSDDSVSTQFPSCPTFADFMDAHSKMEDIVGLVRDDPEIGANFLERCIVIDEFKRNKKILLVYIFQNGLEDRFARHTMNLLLEDFDYYNPQKSKGAFYYIYGDEKRVGRADATTVRELIYHPNVRVIPRPKNGFGPNIEVSLRAAARGRIAGEHSMPGGFAMMGGAPMVGGQPMPGGGGRGAERGVRTIILDEEENVHILGERQGSVTARGEI